MILLLGGTSDARDLLNCLSIHGQKVVYSALTAYGGSLTLNQGAEEVLVGELTEELMLEVIRSRGIKYVVDATHPYAETISRIASHVAIHAGLPYLRYLRPVSKLDHPTVTDIYYVAGVSEAIETAAALGDRILLTTGSKTLEDLAGGLIKRGKTVFVRVLPQVGVVEKCLKLGLNPNQIIAIQGPFNREFNSAMVRHFNVQVMVTKDSGTAGGFEEKVAAASALKIPLVVLTRPVEKDQLIFTSKEDLLNYMRR